MLVAGVLGLRRILCALHLFSGNSSFFPLPSLIFIENMPTADPMQTAAAFSRI
jgi:hypothetical protein